MRANARILLVEAAPAHRALAVRLLTDAGYAVTVESDPSAASPPRAAFDLALLVARQPVTPARLLRGDAAKYAEAAGAGNRGGGRRRGSRAG
jgi:CheY-like chemotaxis protein